MSENQSGLILPYKDKMPMLAADVFLAPTANVIGDVEIGAATNLWFGVVVRGDVNHIRIGARTNIQDGTVVHVTRGTHPTVIGSGITIGHRAMIHGCTLEDGCFIGMQATVMDGAVVESGAMVGAGALVAPGKRVLRGELWVGAPARKARTMTDDEHAEILRLSDHYCEVAATYMAAGIGRTDGKRS